MIVTEETHKGGGGMIGTSLMKITAVMVGEINIKVTSSLSEILKFIKRPNA